MRPSRLLPVAAALVLLAVPAAADAPLVVDDPCADVDPVLHVDPMINGSVSVGPADVTMSGKGVDPFDVRQVRVQDLVAGEEVVGVEVALHVCADLEAPGTPGSRWAVAWDLPARPGTTSCYGEVRVTEALSGTAVQRSAFLSETCSRPAGGPLGGSTAASLYDVALPDWDVVGDTITWRLDRDALPGPAADQLEPGTTWGGVRADTRDGRQGTVLSYGTERGDVVRASGPGASDRTDRGGDHVVG